MAMRDEFTKAERHVLHELSGEVYEAETAEVLESLAQDIDAWRAGRILPSELLERVHEFDRNDAKNHWLAYQHLRPPDIVARGVVIGQIAENKLPHELLVKLRARIEAHRRS